jgi:hypothetical protein
MKCPQFPPASLSPPPGRLASGLDERAPVLIPAPNIMLRLGSDITPGKVLVAEKNLTYSSNPVYV